MRDGMPPSGDLRDASSPVEPSSTAVGNSTPRSMNDQELRILELETLNRDLEVQLEKSDMENDRLKSRLKTILWEYLPKQRKVSVGRNRDLNLIGHNCSEARSLSSTRASALLLQNAPCTVV